MPVSQQTPALHDNSSSVADIDGGRPTKGLSTNQSQDADYQGAAALLLDQKRWLRTFYATHNPRRLHDHPELVEELLAKWYGREQELFRRLQVKYDRLAKEIRNGKAALKAVANSLKIIYVVARNDTSMVLGSSRPAVLEQREASVH